MERINFLKLNNNPESLSESLAFFVSNGFTSTIYPYEDDVTGWSRRYKLKIDNLELILIWFNNLSTIRIGEWEDSFIEIGFDEIRRSATQNCEHATYDFISNSVRRGQLSIADGGFKSW